jgi:hypothetical protein
MNLPMTVTLDDKTGAYLERIAADQNRDPAEVAAWILTTDLRREQGIDNESATHLNSSTDEQEIDQTMRRASA